ncbi:MAG: GNAT family N-acetyltransferase [Cyclobacteriaceae bacterium]
MLLDLALCTIRQWKQTDVPDLVRYANNRAVWFNLRDTFPHPYTEADARKYITISNGQNPVSSFAIEVNGCAAGSIGFMIKSGVYARTVELGYWLAEDFWGRGIATCAASGMLSYVLQKYNPVRVYACCFEWNKGSARVLEKAGFHLEARLKKGIIKDGRVGDELIYAFINK